VSIINTNTYFQTKTLVTPWFNFIHRAQHQAKKHALNFVQIYFGSDLFFSGKLTTMQQKNQCPMCQKVFASPSGFWYHKQKDKVCYPVAPPVRRRKKKKRGGSALPVGRSNQKRQRTPGNLGHLVAKREGPLKIRVFALSAEEEDIQYCLNLPVDKCVEGEYSFAKWDLPEEVEHNCEDNFEDWALACVHVP
jgi:hypothetical protein